MRCAAAFRSRNENLGRVPLQNVIGRRGPVLPSVHTRASRREASRYEELQQSTEFECRV